MITTFRVALAVLLVGHGVAHVPGFLVAWRLRAFPTLPYTTMAMNGMLDVGHIGTRILGALWLLAGITSATAGGAVLLRTEWAYPLAGAVLFGSVILCVLGWPAARLGLFANMLMIVLLFVLATLDGRLLPGSSIQ